MIYRQKLHRAFISTCAFIKILVFFHPVCLFSTVRLLKLGGSSTLCVYSIPCYYSIVQSMHWMTQIRNSRTNTKIHINRGKKHRIRVSILCHGMIQAFFKKDKNNFFFKGTFSFTTLPLDCSTVEVRYRIGGKEGRTDSGGKA